MLFRHRQVEFSSIKVLSKNIPENEGFWGRLLGFRNGPKTTRFVDAIFSYTNLLCAVNIFQVIVQPFLSYYDEHGNFDIEYMSLENLLRSSYTDASLALNLFEEGQKELAEYCKLKPEERRAMDVPQSFMVRKPLLYARSFLYALDSFQKTLALLVKKPHLQHQFMTALNAFNVAFPAIVHIRNSAHHMEDRVRGLKSHEKPIDVQPPTISSFEVEGEKAKITALDTLVGNEYGNLLADGSYGELGVSAAKMTEFQSLYQNLVDSLPKQDNWFAPSGIIG